MLRGVRKDGTGEERLKMKQKGNMVLVHQFIVLSRKIGVEMVPGRIVRRSRIFVTW